MSLPSLLGITMSVLSGILGFCSDDEDVDELDGTIVVTGCSEEVAGAIDDVVLVPQALKEPTVTNARNNIFKCDVCQSVSYN